MSSDADVTRLLVDWSSGRREALDELTPLVYSELRRLARSYMGRERGQHTLQATALVHEAFIRLIDQKRVSWQSRAHFYGIAARMMRRILVDHARKRRAQKRGADQDELSFDESIGGENRVDVISLDEALGDLEAIDPRQHRVVELKYFAGMSIEEIAEEMATSPATVKREWSAAKVWLARELARR